jgi:FkbM family methyltransferase
MGPVTLHRRPTVIDREQTEVWDIGASNPALIYDVGVGNGDDSAYYLHKGFDVIGVEANPTRIPELRTRFAREIADGRYQLQAVAIAEHEGKAQFWICEDKPDWSSFDRSIASRGGVQHRAVEVATRTFRSILERFGVPAFCKVDIEGSDNLCLRALTPATRPKFISIEALDGKWQIGQLSSLGYTRFKIISQRTWRQPNRPLTKLKSTVPKIARRAVAALEFRLMRYAPDPTWHHQPGSSGPFGDDTHGPWRSADEVLADWRGTFGLGYDLSEWHDFHATA